ncbi:peptidoglycan recognition protein [Streptomyces sp. NPDC048514]|uniref:peptidoglycan recognition protein family protein n=1 Tax=Streptomyces sp. NPDC048514 TaxID=3365564 RepID=UPI00371E2DD6
MSKIMGMRGFLTSLLGASALVASSTGVSSAAPLARPPAPPTDAAVAAAAPSTARAIGAPSVSRSRASGTGGSTRSLPLVPLSRDRVAGAAPERGLYRAGIDRFSMVGIVWDDPDTELNGLVQVRTRSAVSGRWSGWEDVETHNADHGADPGTAERTSLRVHGATAPLWVGDSDGVDVRVRAEAAGLRGGHGARLGAALPSGLRLELVDPGEEPPPVGAPLDEPRTGLTTEEAIAASATNTDVTGFGATEIPELDRSDTEKELARLQGPVEAKPHIGPRPRIVTRRGWGADESLRQRGFVYTKKVKVAFVHHTASGNKYTCAQAPSVIRSIYRYHVKSMGWRDMGYNFLVDKCGTIYEGRAGGVTKAVLGAHTLGFNTNSMGIAVIGSYGKSKPSGAAVTAVAKLTAWKLGLFKGNPRGKTYLTSGGGNLYPKGKSVRLNVISGHRDGFATTCPGKTLYAKLGTMRSSAARYQGR